MLKRGSRKSCFSAARRVDSGIPGLKNGANSDSMLSDSIGGSAALASGAEGGPGGGAEVDGFHPVGWRAEREFETLGVLEVESAR